MSEQRVDAHAGWCGFCRSGEHAMCASVKCACPNAGRRNHALRRSTLKEPAVVQPLREAPKQVSPEIELVWEEPPPSNRGGGNSMTGRFIGMLPALKDRPEQWARLASWSGKSSAASAAKRLRKVGPAGYEYKPVIREGRSLLYARYMGEVS